jgi:hypothetical protein
MDADPVIAAIVVASVAVTAIIYVALRVMDAKTKR